MSETVTSETQGLGDETGAADTSKGQSAGDNNSEQTSIKLEPMTESELDLEITGVEMGDSSSSNQMGFGQTDWSQNISYSESGEGPEGAEGYDSGSQSDFGNSKWIVPIKF